MQARCRALAAAVAVFAVALVAGATVMSAESQRTISFFNIHNQETLTSVYKKDGRYVPAEMVKINWILRDWRKDEATTMDPALIDLLWEIHSELGSAEPIHIISGYRSRGTNDMLRKTVGGQASESRHILGKAADVHFPDVPVKNLRYSALIREKGGVGYYPTSAIPFVHVDIDRVRAWPRLPRAELALLFPSGRTQHVPDDGEPITKDDVREARAKNKELATQMALFHESRARPRSQFQTASLTPPLPQLLSPPRPADRRMALGTQATDAERARLAALTADPPPRLLIPPAPANRRPASGDSGGGLQVAAYDPTDPATSRSRFKAPLYREPHVVPAPAYDEEHPEELSYRPFPIAPFLTATASADDPALTGMVHPDLMKILEMMDQENAAPPMRLRPGVHAAQRMWAQQFKGEAVNLSSLADIDAPAASTRVPNRKVATQPQ